MRSQCSIPVCSRPSQARSWCTMHWKRWWKHGDPLIIKHQGTHRLTNTPTYSSWEGMKARCLNPNDSNYHRYGGRGITICEQWLAFKNFLEDMGTRPDGLTLDRVDNDGNYELDNCRWATWKEQANNRPILPKHPVTGRFYRP